MKKGRIHIGTSGWHYKHWKGTFYPADIKEADQPAYYTGCFDITTRRGMRLLMRGG